MPNDIRDVWQEQKEEGSSMSIDEISTRVRAFRNSIWRRYLGAGIVVAYLAWMAWRDPTIVARVGHLLLIAGVIYIAYQFHSSGLATIMPSDMGLMDCISFHRRVLERQLDLYRHAQRWAIAIVPGIAVFIVSGVVRVVTRPHLPTQVEFYVMLVAFLGVIFIILDFFRARNQLCMRELERQIRELDEVRQN